MYEELVKKTNAYKLISTEKKNGTLSHAYLIVSQDKPALKNYLVELAKLIECEGDENGEKCRACRLIEKNAYTDCTFYPTEGEKILTADIDDLVSKTYIKPLENSTRLFVISGAENMNAAAQNKLLKTLEEPPRNVCILIGATNTYGLLPTVLSRVKRIDIPFPARADLISALKSVCSDEKKLNDAISLSDGSLSGTLSVLNDDKTSKLSALCREILSSMRSSADVIKYVPRVEKEDMKQFIAAMRAEISSRLKRAFIEKQPLTDGYTKGALTAISDRLTEAEKAMTFSANAAMTVDKVLLGIAEEKHKWQKL